ncbi:MAG: hypothetical protein U0U46_06820 [Saprospiraceae bacterium]|nr:hypothetical protein [Saprospiraceae bacterium]HNL39820.1 hypothetical protein [Saprospiraceae bacterium]
MNFIQLHRRFRWLRRGILALCILGLTLQTATLFAPKTLSGGYFLKTMSATGFLLMLYGAYLLAGIVFTITRKHWKMAFTLLLFLALNFLLLCWQSAVFILISGVSVGEPTGSN